MQHISNTMLLRFPFLLYFCSVLLQFTNNEGHVTSMGFAINTRFLGQPFARSVIIPDILLNKFLKLATRGELFSKNSTWTASKIKNSWQDSYPNPNNFLMRVTSKRENPNCTAHYATKICCDKWYINGTTHHRHCKINARSGTPKYRYDKLNDIYPSKVSKCLFHDSRALCRCCAALYPKKQEKQEQCIETRMNIMKTGLRVCFLKKAYLRRACCKAIFKGREILYKRCVSGIAVFVNRQAPCVYKSIVDQKRCCQKLFSSTKGDHNHDKSDWANSFCNKVVKEKENSISRCMVRTEGEKKKCCKYDGLFGKGRYRKCMDRPLQPCRNGGILDRIICCYNIFPGDASSDSYPSRSFRDCTVREYINCQWLNWKKRTACCAMKYHMGSLEMKRCIYQFVNLEVGRSERERFQACMIRNVPGSKLFRICLFSAIKICHISSLAISYTKGKEDSSSERRKCCKQYFQSLKGIQACLDMKEFPGLLKTYKASYETWKDFSNFKWPVSKRVTYCEKYLKKNCYLECACLSEIAFEATEYQLYHFTLFPDNALEENVMPRCSIFKVTEREWCCRLNFQKASSSFSKCMTWNHVASKLYRKPSAQKNAEYTKELKKADMLRKNWNGLAAGYGARNQQKKLKSFLEAMRVVEDSLLDETNIPYPLMKIYRNFQIEFSLAVKWDMTATFFERECNCWRSCTTVYRESDLLNWGIVYCAKMTNRWMSIKRKAVLGWEMGLVEEIVEYVDARKKTITRKNSSKEDTNLGAETYVKHSHSHIFVDLFGNSNNGFSIENGGNGLNRYGEMHDNHGIGMSGNSETYGTIDIEKNPFLYTNGMKTVNLFGTVSDCGVTNLIYACNALCCDTYFALSWICQTANLDCIG